MESPRNTNIIWQDYWDSKRGKLSVRYIGVPLISGKLAEVDYRPLIDKTSRIRYWAFIFLFFAGRL